MPDKPEIEKIHALHNLESQFDVPEEMRHLLHSQLSDRDRDSISRFVRGFKIEDWFQWIFSAMPWAMLIHGLHQEQFPDRSKMSYQVSDFLTIIETSKLTPQPLLVEVKRVSGDEMTLKVNAAQMTLCERYASDLRIPLVYAIYWEKLNAWTVNTPDSFQYNSSKRKLSMARAFDHDCSSIFGDVSFFVPQGLVRTSCFDAEVSCGVVHEHLGAMISDVITLGSNQVRLTGSESAAIDSMLTMKTLSTETIGAKTTLVQTIEDNYMLKLSSWITRHLSMFEGITPTAENSNVSANVISHLMTRLECTVIHLFPNGKTSQLSELDSLFRIVKPVS